jgi:hypothetical protein
MPLKPLGGAPAVIRMRRQRTDTGNAEELGQFPQEARLLALYEA